MSNENFEISTTCGSPSGPTISYAQLDAVEHIEIHDVLHIGRGARSGEHEGIITGKGLRRSGTCRQIGREPIG